MGVPGMPPGTRGRPPGRRPRAHPWHARGREPATVTALVVAAVAAKVREHPNVKSRRAGRKLLVLDDVDLIVTVERTTRTGEAAPVPMVVHRADTKTAEAIAAEFRTGRTETQAERSPALMTRLPFWVVRAGAAIAGTIPRWASRSRR